MCKKPPPMKEIFITLEVRMPSRSALFLSYQEAPDQAQYQTSPVLRGAWLTYDRSRWLQRITFAFLLVEHWHKLTTHPDRATLKWVLFGINFLRRK